MLQPTKLLIEKTKIEEFGRLPEPPPVKVFHGDTVGQNVAHQLAEYLVEPEDRPHVVMATHQVLPRIPFLADARAWDLVIDEVPQVDREQAHIVPTTHPFITNHLQVEQHDGVYGRIKLTEPEAIKAIARNSDEDELLEQFRETATILTSKHWPSYVHLEQFAKLMMGTGKALNIHSILSPSIVNGFASVFIAGANFEDTGLFALWSKMGIQFKEDTNFAKGLRYRTHANGKLATIHFAMERNWSRNLLEQSTDGKPNLERLRDAAKLVFEDREFLWQANKSVPDNFFKGAGQRLPNNPLGLNEFDNIHDVVFLSALNPSPTHGKFLLSRGMTPSEIERQGYCGVAYQAIMRTSLRDFVEMTPKNIIVPDERLARYLADMLPGSQVQKLDTGISDHVNRGGRPRVYKDDSHKQRQRRAKEAEKRTELLAEVFVPRKPQGQEGTSSSEPAMCCNETSISLYRGSLSSTICTLLSSESRTNAPENFWKPDSKASFPLISSTKSRSSFTANRTAPLSPATMLSSATFPSAIFCAKINGPELSVGITATAGLSLAYLSTFAGSTAGLPEASRTLASSGLGAPSDFVADVPGSGSPGSVVDLSAVSWSTPCAIIATAATQPAPVSHDTRVTTPATISANARSASPRVRLLLTFWAVRLFSLTWSRSFWSFAISS